MAGLSQDDLANLLGTNASTISGWERGEHQPSAFFREKMCSTLNMSADELGFLPSEESSIPAPIYDPSIPLQTVLIGMNEHLIQLRQHMQGSKKDCTVLLGLPGVGKTALAAALTYDQKIRRYFSHGILWAGLGPQPDITGLLSHWGKLLDIVPPTLVNVPTKEAWTEALHNAIGNRSLLLIIDDVWSVEDALYCQVGGPNCSYLLTTRFPTIAHHVSIDGITKIEPLNMRQSMDLLRLLAPGVLEREREKAQKLVTAVGGLPLALTLIGNYVRKQSYSGQPRRIQTALQRLSDAAGRLQLSEPRAPFDPHPSLPIGNQLSLQAIIAISDQQLTEEEQKVLYALSIFPPKPHTFSEAAALAVTISSIEILDALVDAGLLESYNEDRYNMHQTIVDYARLQLQGHEVHERLIVYALSVVRQLQTHPHLLENEWSTILAALECAYELQKHAELVYMEQVFIPFLLVQGMSILAQQHIQRMMETAMTIEDDDSVAHAHQFREDLKQRQHL